MNALLLATFLLIQGLANSIQAPTGVITGTLRLSNGDPAVYVRVAAMRAPEAGAADTTADAGALFSQTQTDQAGRYRLEGIPPGQYFVVAGRLNDPTFFARGAKAEPASVSITSGVPIEKIDFTIADSSARPPDAVLDPLLSLVLTPVRVRVMTDDGGPIPVASPTGRLLLRVTATSPAGVQTIGTLLPAQFVTVQRIYGLGASAPLSPAGSGNIRNDGSGEIFVVPGEYRLSLANLPDKYEVRAITYNGVDALPVPVRIVSSGDVRVVVGLKKVAPPRTGLAVRGRVLDALSGTSATAESVRLSQLPGSLFSDGTYEFTNVVPGSHLLEVFEGQPGDRTANVQVAVGNTDIVVDATYTTRPAAVKVNGRFVVEGGGTFDDARVLTGSAQAAAVVAAPDGTFMVTLREGEYPLAFSVSPVGFMVKSITLGSTPLSERKLLIDGAKGAIAPELVVTLAPMPRVRLHVRVSATQPTTRSVADAHVTLSGPERHQTTLGADGTFELPVLPGDYRLEIHPFGFTSVRESISVKPGSDVRLMFTSIPLY